jgi:hypothetical protein
MSKHYNKENRFGIHNHTNTRYRGVTNFRYWANSVRALQLFDFDTLMELTTFVKLPNFTFSKRKDDDLDDRVLSLIWAMFILDPSIATKYFNIIETDDQGRPLKIKPLVDNTDLIKKSPIFYGQASNFKKNPIVTTSYSFVGKFEASKPITQDTEEAMLRDWLLNWGQQVPPPPLAEPLNQDNKDKKDKLFNGEDYYPTVIF